MAPSTCREADDRNAIAVDRCLRMPLHGHPGRDRRGHRGHRRIHRELRPLRDRYEAVTRGYEVLPPTDEPLAPGAWTTTFVSRAAGTCCTRSSSLSRTRWATDFCDPGNEWRASYGIVPFKHGEGAR